MANPKFCFPNWLLPSAVYTPTITGAGWIDLPKLQGDVLSEMARYPGVNPANTKLAIDLKAMRNIRVLVIPFHNAQPGDTARIRIATDAAFNNVVLDTGALEFFREAYPFGALEWGAEQWVDGKLTVEQSVGQNPNWIYVAPNEVLGRYLDVQLDFSTNPSGYVDIGQIVASPAFSPAYNVDYGVAVPFYRDPSTKVRSKGGAVFVERQRPYLYTKMQLSWINTQELYGRFYEMVRQYGVSVPFFFIYDSDAIGAYLQKQSFMAIAESYSDPVNSHLNNNQMVIELSQAF